MAFKIKIERFAVGCIPHQPFEHSDHFGAFFIDCGRVKIIDLDKAVGPDRMRQWAVIFGKLVIAQTVGILDAFHRRAAHIRSKLRVAKHRQPFFEAELKPVPASDPIAGPVVKILMRYDGFDHFKIGIRTGARIGQNAGAVENIKPLIFHRAHIEIIDRNDVEQIKIIFAPVDLFIPVH